ncbi:7TM diverse intracellular signaling domain-containing protein [Pseudopedobacter beijingensis]|uniref:histidine kinase n=1 Tax=Pseudopedobacter beijingensis TaxID=1207056 RepID=A0ABW4I9X0_9SPHI
MKKVFIILICFHLLLIDKSYSQAPVIFQGENIIIGNSLSILEDKSKILKIEEIQKSTDFTPSDSQTPGLKLSNSNFWLKFSIENRSHGDDLVLMIENSTLDNCELFYFKNGKYESKNISTNQRFNERKYPHQNALFDLNVPEDSTQTFYIRINSTEQMILPIILGAPQNITNYLINHDIVWGILIGILGVMIFYNLFLFISTKDSSYLYYILYTAFTLLTQITLSGYTFKYIFYNYPAIYNKALVVFPGLAGIFGILFIQSFLQTKVRTPSLNKAFILSLLLYSSAVIFRVIGLGTISYRLIDISAIYTIFVIYIVATKIALNGYRPAKFFLLAWSVFFIGLILYILRNSGILPYNFYTNYTMQIGTTLEVTLLSLALADRINILKKEKELSQAEALRISKENEQIIREQNIVLEQKVTERTAELQEANEELHVTLEDLKQTQTQLVAAEKMASLGQLTAGIAHEINNPINFVTSNVSPLQRDVKMLFDTIDTFEELSLSDKSKQEIGQEIEQYKEDLDYDYLKIEIDHLLKGINDGASRTAEIVKGLRIFSRVDEDDLKKANLTDGLDSTLVIMNSLINSNNIVVERDYNAIPPIECYPGKLNQVFLNIISNAIHAVSQIHKNNGNGKLTISVKEEGPNEVSVTFIDNGCGMGDITISKIFDPFFTTKDVGEGTGLGMSIAYNTVKKHNGTIEVSSELSKGTRIKITLPIVHQQQAEA